MNTRAILTSLLVVTLLGPIRAGFYDNFITTVAVVEYQPELSTDLTLERRITKNADNYIDILKSLNNSQPVDLIVFPEATLNSAESSADLYSHSTYLYWATDRDNPCDYTDLYPEYIQKLSCAAREYKTYIVANTIEKERCGTNVTGNCKKYGHYLFNTDVVFDDVGDIKNRYRKINLFGENDLDKPYNKEQVYFFLGTRNTFGLFTCFDILFQNPAELLIKQGIKNFVFPNKWYSELPFLTSLQTQQMWAQTHEVSLFAAGANNPVIGSGGSGIYNGSVGPIKYDIIPNGGSNTYVYKFLEQPPILDPLYASTRPSEQEIDLQAKQMSTFKLLVDDKINDFTSVVLNVSLSFDKPYTKEVCHGSKFCCDFTIRTSFTGVSRTHQYAYHLVAYSGTRSFSGFYNGGVEVCGVIACLNSSVSSCGQRFNDYDNVGWPFPFEEIVIKANFSTTGNRTQYPNSLLSSIRPVNPRLTSWTKRDVGEGLIERTFSITEPQSRLLTFAIYGRNFGADSEVQKDNEPDGATVHGLSLFFCSLVMIFTTFL